MTIHFGHLGNGTTCYDVDRTVNHDYPTIAHISDAGNIHWYKENCKSLTPEAKQIIESYAAKERKKVRDYIMKITEPDCEYGVREVYRILDRLPDITFLELQKNKNKGMKVIFRENIEEILNYL